MASTSSSTSHPNFRFDVFLSFRGEDTRHNFTDHLYHALVEAGLCTFRDNDEIERGQELKPEIETAIIESRASVVVLSENYANSTWCLDELWLILEQRRKLNHFVLPIFCRVDPSDVRNQRGSFAIKRSKVTALIEEAANLSSFLEKDSKLTSLIEYTKTKDFSKKRSRWTEENVRRWKAALTEVANLTGLELSRSSSESSFIADVVETIKRKLDLKQLSTPANLVGMETRVEFINSWLKNEQSNVIAICGMGGGGKTTIAQHIYNVNKQDFQSSSFIEEIGKHSDDLFGLQKKLLKDVLGGKKIRISSVFEGTRKIEEVLQLKKMLIVLDDIYQQEQLSTLLGTKAFPTQSKIIITTRVLDINLWFGTISLGCCVHKLPLLNHLQSIELLSLHAFRSKTPMEDFKELVVQLAQYCGGNPLALKVLGSSLFVNDDDPITINNMIGVWRSRLNSLNSLKGNIDSKIQGVLRKSFDSLPQQSERELLMHIACFFVGENVEVVQKILEDELCAQSGILTLINRCLITISISNKIMMHQLLQEMGRKVVSEESKDPAKCSRVWDDASSYHLLKKGDGSDKVEGLSLDMQKVEQGMQPETLAIQTSSLANMDKLKLLQLKYVKLIGSYENFPKLIWLSWHGSPLKTLPSGLLMSSLVAIDMRYGDMEKFEIPAVLHLLKSLNLTGCDKLVSISNLYRLPNLNALVLRNCRSLTHLCKSIGDLENLGLLDLTGCTKVLKYVNQVDTTMLHESPLLSLPQSLTYIDLGECDINFNGDVCVGIHAKLPFMLNLSENPFEYLPSIIDFKMLHALFLYSCSNLKSIPCIPSMLEILLIDWCTSLERISFQSGRFTLQDFSYEGCFKLSEVEGLFKLVPIAKITESGMGDMQWIKAYGDHKVDLVGDQITEGRIWHTQMLYEYGIMSTYLPGISYQSIPTYEYTSQSFFLSFRVPFHQGKNKIQGLNVMCIYRSLVSDDISYMFAKITNLTTGLTWVYNPVVYCKPKIAEDVVWVSYWPIGNTLEEGDEVCVVIYVDEGKMIVSECGAHLIFMDGEVEEEEKCDDKSLKEKEVVGGDLSEFEVTTNGYYLCHRDIFGLETSYWLKLMFDDHIHYPDSQGWIKTHRSLQLIEAIKEHVNSHLKTIEVGVSFNSESEIDKIEKAVSSLDGFESISTHREKGKLIVTGYVDPIELLTRVRQVDNMVVDILSIKYGNDHTIHT